MENDIQGIKKFNSDVIPFDISDFKSLQYIKIIFLDTDNKLREIQTDAHKMDKSVVQLYLSGEKQFDVECPSGVALKFITADSIFFAKTMLKAIRNIDNKWIFILETPKKTIQQQNRKYYRITKTRPCVMMLNNDKANNKTYIAQTVNISKGGVLLSDVESLFDDQKRNLKLLNGESSQIAIFLKHNLIIKAAAKLVRTENNAELYRYAFQFTDMLQTYFDALDEYATAEEFKAMQTIQQN